MTRSFALLRSTSVVALVAVAVAGCAATTDRGMEQRRQGSIKDDPVDSAPVGAPKRAMTAPVIRVSAPMVTEVLKPAVMVVQTPSDPALRLPTAEPRQQPVTMRVEQPVAPKPEAKEAPAQRSDVRPVDVKPEAPRPEPQKSAASIESPRPQAPADGRQLIDSRRKPANAAPVAPPVVMPWVAPPIAMHSAPPAAAAAPAAPSTKPAPTAPVAAPVVPAMPPAVAAPAPLPDVKKDVSRTAAATNAQVPPVGPKIVPLSDEQRIASVLQRVDTHMKNNRYQDARTLLDDAAKSGNPRLLTALAETYDPLYLRESFTRLSRIGDPEKAIAIYERASKAGGYGLEARIEALKILAGPKR